MILRRGRVPVFPVLAPVFTVVIAVAFTYGQTRFRAPAEVSLALLAAMAVDVYLRRRIGFAARWSDVTGTRSEADR